MFLLNINEDVSSLLKMSRYYELHIFPDLMWLELDQCHFDVRKYILYFFDGSLKIETIIF